VLLQQHVRVLFQRIVDLTTDATVGHEALGRGTHEQLSPNPAQLFRLAEKCGLATKLSRLFRLIAFREAKRLTGSLCFFFNVHPAEMDDKDFVNSLEQAARAVPIQHRLVMEVHEDCVSDVPAMRRLRDRLHSMGIGLAYDDFGAGQSRLAELAEVPPDFLKIDMKLIRGIDQSSARQDMVGALTDISDRLGVRVLAEGIETTEEAACCRRLGCHWAQGFLFGRPVPSGTIPPKGLADTKRVQVVEPMAQH
jgi:EAL domain-containing protein (putative c-di-GMP-specific phosphodiesterase class I)